MQRLSRRQTLKRAAAASALFLADPVFAVDDAPSNRVRLAVIGTGNQGMGLLSRVLNRDLGQVVAVCDVNAGSFGYKSESHFYGREPAAKRVNDHYREKKRNYEACVAVADSRRVFDRNDIDAVIVVVPDHSHSRVSIPAMESGKDVYCEKPLTFSVADGHRMAAAVERYDRILQTGSHERSNPVSNFVCESVKRGLVGDLKKIVTKVGYNNKVGPGPGWRPMPIPRTFDYNAWLGSAPKVPFHVDRCLYRFRFNYDYSGGQITNYGAHSNDMAHWGMDWDTGGPTTIECLDAKFHPDGSLFNTATETVFRATYDNGVELICESGPENVQTRFEGAKGWIQTGYRGTTASDSAWLKELPQSTRDQRGYDAYESHLANFVDCVRSRNDPRAPVEVGNASATLCHLANIAIRRFPKVGREVLKWDHAKQQFIGNDEANRLLGERVN